MREKLLTAVDQSINPKTLIISWNDVSNIVQMEKNTCKVQYQNVCVPQFKQFTLREQFYIIALFDYYNHDFKAIHQWFFSDIHYCNFVHVIKQNQKIHEKFQEFCKNKGKQKVEFTEQEKELLKKQMTFYKETFIDQSNIDKMGHFELKIKDFGEKLSSVEVRLYIKIKKLLYEKKEQIDKFLQIYEYLNKL